jgi:hypothetical protein
MSFRNYYISHMDRWREIYCLTVHIYQYMWMFKLSYFPCYCPILFTQCNLNLRCHYSERLCLCVVLMKFIAAASFCFIKYGSILMQNNWNFTVAVHNRWLHCFLEISCISSQQTLPVSVAAASSSSSHHRRNKSPPVHHGHGHQHQESQSSSSGVGFGRSRSCSMGTDHERDRERSDSDSSAGGVGSPRRSEPKAVSSQYRLPTANHRPTKTTNHGTSHRVYCIFHRLNILNDETYKWYTENLKCTACFKITQLEWIC